MKDQPSSESRIVLLPIGPERLHFAVVRSPITGLVVVLVVIGPGREVVAQQRFASFALRGAGPDWRVICIKACAPHAAVDPEGNPHCVMRFVEYDGFKVLHVALHFGGSVVRLCGDNGMGLWFLQELF